MGIETLPYIGISNPVIEIIEVKVILVDFFYIINSHFNKLHRLYHTDKLTIHLLTKLTHHQNRSLRLDKLHFYFIIIFLKIVLTVILAWWQDIFLYLKRLLSLSIYISEIYLENFINV